MKEAYSTGDRVRLTVGGKLEGQPGIITGLAASQYSGYFLRYRVKLDCGPVLVAFTNWIEPQGESYEKTGNQRGANNSP